MQDRWLCTWRFKSRLAPAGLVAAHVAGCSLGVHKVLKSEWEVEAVSPGVADHITLGIAARAGLVAAHVADGPPGGRNVLKSEWEVGAMSPGVADHITLGMAGEDWEVMRSNG